MFFNDFPTKGVALALGLLMAATMFVGFAKSQPNVVVIKPVLPFEVCTKFHDTVEKNIKELRVLGTFGGRKNIGLISKSAERQRYNIPAVVPAKETQGYVIQLKNVRYLVGVHKKTDYIVNVLYSPKLKHWNLFKKWLDDPKVGMTRDEYIDKFIPLSRRGHIKQNKYLSFDCLDKKKKQKEA